MFKKLLPLLALLAAPVASAQIDPYTIAKIYQDGIEVGIIRSDLPPGPCRSVEHWFLYEGYSYPSERGGGFDVVATDQRDPGLERFLATAWAEHPRGTLVTVETQEFSRECRY